MGGSETDPGIFINWSLRLGTTATRCITFNKFWPISRDLVFDIRILELWVVNEVLMKKSRMPKRDFYSTVVMWNRIGKHKNNGGPQERKKDGEGRCCHCSPVHEHKDDSNQIDRDEVHETELRHFEPSNPSLTTSPMDDELLLAIKNRLAGIPPNISALSQREKLRTSNESPLTNTKPFHIMGQSTKKKATPQVDDSLITEIKHQGTSTSHIKVASTYTQSALSTDDRSRLTQFPSKIQRIEDEYQNEVLHEKAHSQQTSGRMHRSSQGYYLPLRRDSFSTQNKRAWPPQYPKPPDRFSAPTQPHIGIGDIQCPSGLPGVPEYYGVSTERPSISRAMISEGSYNQSLHERSWGRKNAGALLPFQQQLVRSTPPDHPRPTGGSISSQGRAGELSVQQQIESSPHPMSDWGEPHSNPYPADSMLQEPSTQTRSASPSYQAPPSNPYDEANQHLNGRNGQEPILEQAGSHPEFGDPSSNPYPDQPTESPGKAQPQPPPPPQSSEQIKPEETTVIAMPTQQAQMCRCGSKQLNMICNCKKHESARKDNCNDYRCTERNSKSKVTRGDSKSKKKKAKPDKEAKAEEKRRKKEEKEREKREKKEQKAREKEQKAREKESKKKGKNKKKGKSKGGTNEGMCSCCTCGGNEGETTIASSETEITAASDDRSKKKKSKKEKKSKEKKPKEKKKKKKGDELYENGSSYRSYDYSPQSGSNAAMPGSSCRLGNQEMAGKEGIRFCNHPESPCPGILGQATSYMRESTGGSRLPQSQSPGDVRSSPKLSRPVSYAQTPNDCSCVANKMLCNCNCIRHGSKSGYFLVNALTDQETAAYPAMLDRRSQSPRRSTTSLKRPPNPNPSNGKYGDIVTAPAIIVPSEGAGDSNENVLNSARLSSDPRQPWLPSGINPTRNLLIDVSKKGRESSPNKHYVPPCVLYLDCTKVKDLCVIIKDKYEEP